MRVTVLFHSYFRDLTGCAIHEMEVPPETTIAQLTDRLHHVFPKLEAMKRSTLIAVGVDYQTGEYVLNEKDEVSFFPPVQGG